MAEDRAAIVAGGVIGGVSLSGPSGKGQAPGQPYEAWQRQDESLHARLLRDAVADDCGSVSLAISRSFLGPRNAQRLKLTGLSRRREKYSACDAAACRSAPGAATKRPDRLRW